MVDEAHRTQEGDLGSKMRLALPNAFFFGLTGTPINRRDKNTFYTFGAYEDKSGYMSKYTFADSMRDQATLPLHFEPVPMELHIDRDTINAEFDIITKNLSDEDRSKLTKRINMETLMKAPERIRKVCEHIARHYTEKIEPNGFKGQVVCYNRECCFLYKNELDKLIGEQATTIVMDTNDDKQGKYKDFRRNRDEERKVLDRFCEPYNELKLVIVTSKLLTGFDAPVLQVMYLDKPMKDHTLLQAICRTNRIYGQHKTHGLIVDYIGIFDDVARALEFDEKSVIDIITNIDKIKELLPALLYKCLSYFHNVDRTIEGWDGLMAAQEALPNNEKRDAFGADFRILQNAWETLSPNPILIQYKPDYLWLTKIYESIKPFDDNGRLIWATLGAKTMALIHENTTVDDPPDITEILKLDDPDLIEKLFEQHKDHVKIMRDLEIDIMSRIRSHGGIKRFIELGVKLEELRERHAQGLINSIEFIKQLLELAHKVRQAENETVPEEEHDIAKAALTELFKGIRTESTPIIVERLVADIDEIVKKVRFSGWQNTDKGIHDVQKEVHTILWVKYQLKDQEIFDKTFKYIEQYY